MVRDKPKRQVDVILLIATHVIFVKSSYLSRKIGYMFSMSMLLTQLFIGRFWYDDDYDENDDFVYILILIMFITYHMFSGMELWEVCYCVSFQGQLQFTQADL